MIMQGNQLSPEVQADALRRFVHRFTKEHVPLHATRQPEPVNDIGMYSVHASYLVAGKRCYWPVQFESDAEWLANTDFDVTKDGRLDARCNSCHARPTWPDNPELRK